MNWWIFIEGQPELSVAIWIVLAVAVLYFARPAVHAALYRISRLASALLRLQARALHRVISNLKARNREVLLEMGKGQMERRLDRDFHRVNEIVSNDLGNYPELQKTISRLVTQLEEDYHNSAETPPPSPDWIEAIEAIVNLKEAQKGNPVIVKVLEDLYSSLQQQQKKTLDSYREGVNTRHKLLHAMMPHWRKLNNAVERVGGSMKNLVIQAEEIDKNMDRYREIHAGSDKAERMLRVSSLREFSVALFWMAVFAGGAFFNFHLIALPMSEMVGAGTRIGAFTVAEVSALMIVLIEIAIGMLLMEVLHITRMFPAFGTLDERKRRILFWTLLGFVFLFASIESGLAFMRDQIASDNAALRSLLVGGEAVALEGSSAISQVIPQAAQMLLGFLLPFVLIFVAIPFESFVESGRVLLADLLIQILHLLIVIMRLVATAIRYLTDILLALYDILVSIPLWIEHRLSHRAPTESSDESKSKLLKDPS
ncbi:hypothetical protein [Reinekea blandensis]|uniref:Uncharacterized protein n=1 Tax=Reinekea blandensis MED297 TaxID=314283 RepID=A4BHY8_9GAMM|nr:hypothetical protein [Reinekea blandensis]EAR08260.1 hypothetical protein MED297_13957 [Reinekea sp. MED297] [Reinekea blandensis MED297]